MSTRISGVSLGSDKPGSPNNSVESCDSGAPSGDSQLQPHTQMPPRAMPAREWQQSLSDLHAESPMNTPGNTLSIASTPSASTLFLPYNRHSFPITSPVVSISCPVGWSAQLTSLLEESRVFPAFVSRRTTIIFQERLGQRRCGCPASQPR